VKGRMFKWCVWLAVLAAALIIAAEIIVLELRRPPVEAFEQAMASLAAAEATGAASVTVLTYRDALWHMQAGKEAMHEVSSGWWPFGSYRTADSLLRESIRLSDLAATRSGEKQKRLRAQTELEFAVLRDSLKFWRGELDRMLPRTQDELLYRSAASRLDLATELLKRGQREHAGLYVDTILILLDSLETSLIQRLAAKKEQAALWQDWTSQTISDSRTSGGVALIVDKSSHRLYALSAGRVVDSFPCDLGFNSGHQKQKAGDGATPEGTYRVSRINGGSKYYRALLLDYPNSDDRKRFEDGIHDGTVPARAKIGGLIEIHGHGGTGRDWTDGCVAVTDGDMDKLLRIASVGTAVTIVRVWERLR